MSDSRKPRLNIKNGHFRGIPPNLIVIYIATLTLSLMANFALPLNVICPSYPLGLEGVDFISYTALDVSPDGKNVVVGG
jgi:hypothetical protein